MRFLCDVTSLFTPSIAHGKHTFASVRRNVSPIHVLPTPFLLRKLSKDIRKIAESKKYI